MCTRPWPACCSPVFWHLGKAPSSGRPRDLEYALSLLVINNDRNSHFTCGLLLPVSWSSKRRPSGRNLARSPLSLPAPPTSPKLRVEVPRWCSSTGFTRSSRSVRPRPPRVASCALQRPVGSGDGRREGGWGSFDLLACLCWCGVMMVGSGELGRTGVCWKGCGHRQHKTDCFRMP